MEKEAYEEVEEKETKDEGQVRKVELSELLVLKQLIFLLRSK